MYSEEEIKQIRIDLLTAADQVFNDYNRGLLAADRLQKKWNCNLLSIAVDLENNGYIKGTSVFGVDSRFKLGSLTDKGRKYLKEMKERGNNEQNSIVNNFNSKTQIGNF